MPLYLKPWMSLRGPCKKDWVPSCDTAGEVVGPLVEPGRGYSGPWRHALEETSGSQAPLSFSFLLQPQRKQLWCSTYPSLQCAASVPTDQKIVHWNPLTWNTVTGMGYRRCLYIWPGSPPWRHQANLQCSITTRRSTLIASPSLSQLSLVLPVMVCMNSAPYNFITYRYVCVSTITFKV